MTYHCYCYDYFSVSWSKIVMSVSLVNLIKIDIVGITMILHFLAVNIINLFVLFSTDNRA